MNPMHWLFALFVLVPLIEIYLLITVGSWIGAAATVCVVVMTAIIGMYLLRWQGFSTLQRVRAALAQGQLPAMEMLEGIVLLIAGALLLTPGFFTDTLGFLALVPGLRSAAVLWFMDRNVVPGDRPDRNPSAQSPRTIEGECRREDE
ncbi:MAG: FxsA family protein [Gammaproteobacteria bacterium]